MGATALFCCWGFGEMLDGFTDNAKYLFTLMGRKLKIPLTGLASAARLKIERQLRRKRRRETYEIFFETRDVFPQLLKRDEDRMLISHEESMQIKFNTATLRDVYR